VEKAAAVLAGEQPSGTFVAVLGETEELKQRFAARVEKITPLETMSRPALPRFAQNRPLNGTPPLFGYQRIIYNIK
jgi:ribulose-bisphosphate carboxylase large chain